MDRPNILVFMPDQMLGDVTHPGHPCIMPNVERLAAEGVNFTNTFCPTAHCCPSRASFYTGEYPSRHGVWNNVSNRCAIRRDLEDGVPNLGPLLKEAGYNLGHSGKWHISDFKNPEDFGWQEYFLTAPKGRWQHSRIELYDERQANPEPPPSGPGVVRRPGWGDVAMFSTREAGSEQGGGDMKVTREGIRAIQELSAEGEPWCVFVSCGAPHDTYNVPAQYVNMYDGVDVPLPPSWYDDLSDKPRIYQRMRRQYWNQMSPDTTRGCIRHYWAYCTMVDDLFGQLLSALEETGQADNTMVLFTSDHGDYCGAHGLWCKGIPSFREGYAIPNVMRWPGGIANPGRVVDDLISTCDFMPTLVDLAGGETPAVYGDPLRPFLEERQPARWRDDLHVQMNGVELYYTQRIVRTKRWKYVYNGFDFDEMYDLENDPHETVNLAFPDRYPQDQPCATDEHVPWPRLTPELEEVRKDMYARMWHFAREQEDHFVYTPYLTTAQASYGPLYAFR